MTATRYSNLGIGKTCAIHRSSSHDMPRGKGFGIDGCGRGRMGNHRSLRYAVLLYTRVKTKKDLSNNMAT